MRTKEIQEILRFVKYTLNDKSVNITGTKDAVRFQFDSWWQRALDSQKDKVIAKFGNPMKSSAEFIEALKEEIEILKKKVAELEAELAAKNGPAEEKNYSPPPSPAKMAQVNLEKPAEEKNYSPPPSPAKIVKEAEAPEPGIANMKAEDFINLIKQVFNEQFEEKRKEMLKIDKKAEANEIHIEEEVLEA
jgi:hypothetical protein